ncbi:hypothetical protein PV10_06526 [Exophiala mesophila]|uniref:Actin cytoskeleton-regulatory complex protein SLA1 n=1 Tax=Exophiala mesophila TaxID=212818 RepID=A0A0D1ZBJ3_EXOME|nr:uncharacterized protein PV10_06526 [Exophiala mesophila]KIV92052.1 hypothetical protein PV10_06526 [Exophiala mesophila]
MGFVAICTALYAYQPQSAGELEIHEGELLYILEKSTEDDWWKAKKKAQGEDDDEPEGLIPNNYVQDAKPSHAAKALYDYTRQTDEEVSFTEDATLSVYDTSDPDWTLIGVNGEFGFAPANYIELSSLPPQSPDDASPSQSYIAAPAVRTPTSPTSPTRSVSGPAADLARVLGATTSSRSAIAANPPPREQDTPDASDDEGAPPDLPRRPNSDLVSPPAPIQPPSRHEDIPGIMPSPPYNRATSHRDDDHPLHLQTPSGYHLYNINEMVSAMGRRKKMPTTLGVNIATGVIMLSPEKSRDGPSQEWTADKMTHYSIEGKHVFIELVRPSKSLDLHAGAKDTAEEIVRALGEIAGAHRAEGIREVIEAASGGGHKKGQVLYDFMAQGDDEVTVGVGDEVMILDDTKSEEWWNVRRLKNGAEGVVPSIYIEVTGVVAAEPPSRTGINAGRSAVEQNRLEEERLAREAARADRARQDAEHSRARSRSEVGPGVQLPERGSSLADESSQRKHGKDKDDRRKSRSKPDLSKVRTWTDHSGTFKVEAQFLGVADGKIHLHKVNGIKIAVPVTKMSPEDLAYVEKVTNEPIEDHIPVADLIKMKRKSQSGQSSARAGATIEPRAPEQSKTPDYDWFDFFLKAGVGPHQCERYAQAMIKDSMDESILPDITTDTLRTLGLREGDALRVMKYLDQLHGRTKGAANGVNGAAPAAGIFSGEGGALHNNTRRGRPDANRQVGDVVDADALNQKSPTEDKPPEGAKATPLTQAPAREPQSGFDDDAWTVKPSANAPAAAKPQSPPAVAPAPKPLTGAAADLNSLLDPPLIPTPAPPPQQQLSPQPPQPTQLPPQSATSPAPGPGLAQQPQQTGANPQFFAQIPPQATGYPNPQLNLPRQRPQAPQQSFTGAGLLPPPPRPTSAPQNPSQFGQQPLQPQLTGIPRTAALQTAPGQSLNDLNQQRMQQQYQQMSLQPQPTGFVPQSQFGQYGLAAQQTGFPQQQQFGQFQQQPYLNGNAAGSPFADPRTSFQPQPTGIPFQQSPPPGGLNTVLPPALQPQRTSFSSPLQQSQTNGFQQPFQAQGNFPPQQTLQPQQTGFPQPMQPMQPMQTGFGQMPQSNGFGGFQAPPVPPIPQQVPTPAPLQPQKTGPAPPVKFGVTDAKKLVAQPTGRRANLANATANNPFGF